jgi:tetratricopeptide (TPR) repeat protein
MKKIHLFLLIFGINTFIYSQSSDERIAELFASQDYFTLKQEFPQLSKNASEQLILFSAAYIDSYFNKPSQANETIQLLLEKYPDWLGAENHFALALLMANNYVKEQNYRFAASIYEQLITNLEPYWSDTALTAYRNAFRLFKALENVEPMHISYTKKQEIIPLKNDKVGLLTFPVKSKTSQAIDFVMDFGAGFSMIEEQFAKDFGIEILADSVFTTSGTGENIYAKIGVAKEIQIGEIIVQNVVFYVAPKILPESVSDSLNYEIRGIIGFPILSELGHLVIKTSGELIVSKSKPKNKVPANIIKHNNFLYLQAITPTNKLLMQFDSGTPISSLTKQYLGKSNEDIRILALDSLRLTSYGSVKTFPTYKKENFQCTIGHKKITIPAIHIFREDGVEYGFQTDGTIGRDVMKQSKQTIIDFKNMIIDFK